MADATPRPPVKTTGPQRDDLQKLIPDNVRLRRALEQLFIDVANTLPDAIQQVGDNSQATTEDVSMGLFGATDRKASRTQTDLADAIDKASLTPFKRLAARIADVETQVSALQPVKPRVEGFIAPTLVNSWVNYGGVFNTAGYYKDPFGIVHLRGTVKSGTIPAVVFNLPVKYRPSAQEIFSVVSNNAFGRVDVDTVGDVYVIVGNNASVSLDGITFRAA